jgi:TRAP-type C4-dicarboxylate transport system permease small subunit
MDALFKVSGQLAHGLAVLTKLLLAMIVCIVVADVAMRNLARPVAWTTSLTEYLLIYVAFLPAPLLVRLKGHVCADFLRTALPTAIQRPLEKLVYVLCIAICLFLGGIAGQALVDSVRTGAYDVRTFDMPKWLIYLPMLVGFWLSAIEFMRYLAGLDSIYAVDVRDVEGF